MPSPPPPTDQRTRPAPRLTRSRDERVIAGVAGGIGHYLRIDPVIIRIVFVLLALAGGGGLLAYLIGWLVMPDASTLDASSDGAPLQTPVRAGTSVAAGLLLVILGSLLLLERVLPAISWRYLAPGLLIVLGILLLGRRRDDAG